MKGFLRRAADGEEYDEKQDGEALEEEYKRLFMKIGRDFVHLDDFVRVIEAILELIDPGNTYGVDYLGNSGAMSMAAIYKGVLDGRMKGDQELRDLIRLDE
jgi:nucleoside-diphosphate-sugar epimerase